jgi:aminoglycoside phosphotransferase (APT) family kinase protein
MLATLSRGNFQLLRALQTEGRFGEQFEQLRRQWQPDTVIHNDVKGDNVLVLPGEPAARRTLSAIRIVDWEFVQFGDPAWDVAGAFQDFVSLWVNSMTFSALDVEEVVASARDPWPAVRVAVRELWRGYTASAGLSASEAKRLLLRAVAFSSARLIQTAYEGTHPLDVLPKKAVLLLQISANVMSDPEAARGQFYGIA